MYKYRIKIEPIEGAGGAMISDKLREPIECDGFVILGDRGKRSVNVKHDINDIVIASIIAEDTDILGASYIAKAMREASEMQRKSAAGDLFGKLLNLD